MDPVPAVRRVRGHTGPVTDLVLTGATVLGPAGPERRDLAVVGGRIAEASAPSAAAVNLDGLVVAPGYVDLQCNGGWGIDVSSEPERLWDLAAQLPRTGVTAWLPTVVTGPGEVVDRALAALAAGPPPGWRGAVPLGLHLEGPFLNPVRRNAHAAEHLRAPSVEAVAGWSRAAGVAVATLAPELPGALAVVEALVERGVLVSIGHTDATADEARAAVEAGARWVTHLWNAMAPLHHREPGVVGVALTDERLHVGLIVDGIHVHPTAVALAQRLLGPRLVLVTDAVSALGLGAGAHRLGPQAVTVGAEPGVRLADGTLAGSDLAMDQAVRNLVAMTGCSLVEAVTAAATTPARLLGDDDRGVLAPGRRADLVVLDGDGHLVATYVGGEALHRT